MLSARLLRLGLLAGGDVGPQAVDEVPDLEDDVPGGYFLLLYTALQEAFEHQVRLVRFGSGAYDVKRRLGFHLEDTNHAIVAMAGIRSRSVKRLASSE